MTPALLRWLAVLIGVLAVVDPAVTSGRPVRPLVSLITADANAQATADRVARALARRFEVVQGAFGAAAATVVVGARLPDEALTAAPPVVAVLPELRPALRISALVVPSHARRDSRIPVDVTVTSLGGRGQRLEVSLDAGGFIVDGQTVDVLEDSVTARVRLGWAPAAPGVVPLRVTARLSGAARMAAATSVVEVTERPLRLLFFDARPSWHSTFVRRALADDPRLEVTHRLATSRGIANAIGTPPSSLADHRALASYDLIVIGAPDALGPADVAGLEDNMRQRGGRVILLLDRLASGAIDQLLSVRQWRTRRFATPSVIAVDSGVLRARELMWPATLPLAASAVGSFLASGRDGADSSGGTPLWTVPVGAGRLLVSGALDAWHHRDPGDSDFNRFWRQAVARLAGETPALVDVAIARPSLRPGERTVVTVAILLDGAEGSRGPVTTGVSAAFIAGADTTPFRLWPSAQPGRFAGELVAPRAPGVYRLTVGSDVVFTDVAVVVDSLAESPNADESALVAAFASSRGGAAILDSELDRLPDLLGPAFRVASRVETWHPMRSPWWIVPFVLALGGEWWWRRRRGLA